MFGASLLEIYELLYARFGPQGWWPGNSRFEILLGAILTQNTNWGNVEKALANLTAAGCMDPRSLYEMEVGELAELIRPAGYYNVKAKRVKNFLGWLFENFDGDLDSPARMSTAALRVELLGIKGIGYETTDSILLYAFEKITFVVDAYTARIAVRHGLIDSEVGYEELKSLFEDNLAADRELFNEYHALLVRLGKEFCRKTPQCAGCPLEHLPHDVE